MDKSKLVELLKCTIDPKQRQQAEEQLAQVHKIIGFAPTLLVIIMTNDVEMPVRQAAAIYLKNLITQNWAEKESEPGVPIRFSIHEQDRSMIRDSIVQAVIHAPEIIRVQLAVCVSTIVKADFPARWTQIVDKISITLQNPDPQLWSGALLCLYQLVKNFEYKKGDDRAPLNEAMNLLLPMIYELCVRLMADDSDKSVLLQKQILKIYFALTQYVLSMDLISREMFSQWMEIVRVIADRPVPAVADQVDKEERAGLPWWKCKKWALHILHRMYERYGSPGSVTKEYQQFSKWYLQTFSLGILNVLMQILNKYRNKIYIAPRVVQQTLNYINQGVSHALTWKYIQPHMFTIIQDVIFPLMSYSEEDEEMWNTDPHEYVRVKFDIFEDYVSPVYAATILLNSCCKKRKDMLQKTVQFTVSVLSSPNAEPRQKDGALHMIGTIAELLKHKAMYREQVDNLVQRFVFPEFASPHGHMRARAAWTLQFFKFNQDTTAADATRLTANALLTDPELPVKVEACIAIQKILRNHEKCRKLVEPQIKEVVHQLLYIIRETENDDLATVLQQIVCIYKDQLGPISVEICTHLVSTLGNLLNPDEDNSDEKTIAAMGLLNTIETLVLTFGQQVEILNAIEPVILQTVFFILNNSVFEFYEEALELVFEMTCYRVSPLMWNCLDVIFTMFHKDGFDFFKDIMPALHNYVTIDTESLLEPEKAEHRVGGIFEMCRAVLNSGDIADEEAECYAAKLLEVMILQCSTRILNCIPSFIDLVLGRLTREVKTSELRTMCLQVVIAAIYVEPTLVLSILDKITVPNSGDKSITAHFLHQWIHDTNCFLGIHNRKICILGLCRVLSLPQDQRPRALNDLAPQILPSLVLLFDGLQRAYTARAANADESSSESDDGSEDGGSDTLSTDEDELDEQGQEYLDSLKDQIKRKALKQAEGNEMVPASFDVTDATITAETDTDDEDDDDDEDFDGEEDDDVMMENYLTPIDDENCNIDEFVVFKEVFSNLQMQEPQFCNILTQALTDEERKSLQGALVRADQRKAAIESKRIEQSGGYSFTQQVVPTTFNFGGTPIGQ